MASAAVSLRPSTRRTPMEAELFTGIIEEIGRIRSLRRERQGAVLTISAPQMAPALNPGDSVAVNGVCLTVTERRKEFFLCDLSAETLARSSLGLAREGTRVNLERALLVGARLGGHIVQGHVDGMGTLMSSAPSGEGSVMEFSFPHELERYLVPKGSIAVDGISLTVAALGPRSFQVAVIPYTWKGTNLQYLKVGDPVNLEADLLARYFERFFRLGLAGGRPARPLMESLWEEGS